MCIATQQYFELTFSRIELFAAVVVKRLLYLPSLKVPNVDQVLDEYLLQNDRVPARTIPENS